MKDNDLKFRYIYMNGGIKQDELLKLQEIFHKEKNKKKIKEMRKQVENFEYKLSEKNKLEIQKEKLNNKINELN